MISEKYLPKKMFDPTRIPKFFIDFISIGHRQCVSDFNCWAAQKSHHYIIHFNISGKAILFYDDKKTELKKNDVFIFFPNKTYRFIADHDQPLDYVWLSFAGNGADIIMNNNFIKPEKPYGHFEKDISPLFFEIMEIKNTYEKIPEKYGKLYFLLNQFLSVDYNNEQIIPQEHQKNSTDFFFEALSYIAENYNKNIKISELSDYLFISRDYLYKIFITNTGMSPSNFITLYKLNEAMQLLSNRHLSLSEISEVTGFYDVYHFSRTFKKFHGVTPTQYRKELSEIISKIEKHK